MADRKIEGEIKAWTKEVKEREAPTGNYFQLGVLIGDEWHNIPAQNKDTLEDVKNAAPVGSIIEFYEWQREGSTYWNYKPATFKVLKKGEGRKSFGHKNYGYRFTREELLMKEASIQLQAMLKASVEFCKDKDVSELSKTADKLIQYHNDKLLAQTQILKSFMGPGKIEDSKDEEEPVKEELVEEGNGFLV